MSESPARHLNLAGASNFRDLGGYPTSDGRIVRWRQIFRSNHLGHLTDDDIAVLRGLGVRSAFDFRGTEERAEALCGMTDITSAFAAGRAHGGGGAARHRRRRHAAVDGSTPSRSCGIPTATMCRHNTPRYRALFAHLLEDARRW